MELADSIQELPTLAVCICCGAKETINARYFKGKINLSEGKQIVINKADSYEYRPLCKKCYIKEMEKSGK